MEEVPMIRRAAVVVLALAINPALVRAQDTALSVPAVLTVIVDSADVYKAPSNVTPIVGHAPRGTVLPVERNLGSWVRVPWPDASDGFAYVHVTMGRIGPVKAANAAARPASTAQRAAATSKAAAAKPSSQQPLAKPASPKPPAASAPPAIPPVMRRADDSTAPRTQEMVVPASHGVGVGGLVAYARSIGGSARVWRPAGRRHFGAQFSLARNAATNDASTGTVTSMQLEPAFVFGAFDRITDYVWMRPYVGSGVAFRHQSTGGLETVSDSTVGVRLFGGAELTFASAPRFGVSVDAGYRRFQASAVPGADPTRLAVSIAGHWYVR
jgi:hypothetical protein